MTVGNSQLQIPDFRFGQTSIFLVLVQKNVLAHAVKSFKRGAGGLKGIYGVLTEIAHMPTPCHVWHQRRLLPFKLSLRPKVQQMKNDHTNDETKHMKAVLHDLHIYIYI